MLPWKTLLIILVFISIIRITYAASPDCISCHGLGGDDNATRVNVSAMNQTYVIHSYLNNRTGQPGLDGSSYDWNNRRCWACHSNTGNTSYTIVGGGNDHPSKYRNPRSCGDCHRRNDTAGSDYERFLIPLRDNDGIYRLTDDYGAHFNLTLYPNYTNDTMVSARKFNASYYNMTNLIGALDVRDVECVVCHNNSIGTLWTDVNVSANNKSRATWKSNVSHYGVNVSGAPLVGSGLVQGTPGNCTYCHVQGDASVRARWLNATQIRHESNVSHCTNCHGKLDSVNTLHDVYVTKETSVHYAFEFKQGVDVTDRLASCVACHGTNMSFNGTQPAGLPIKICEDCHLPDGSGPYTNSGSWNLRSDLQPWSIANREALGIPIIYNHVPYNNNATLNATDPDAIRVRRNLSNETGGLYQPGVLTASSCFSFNNATGNGTCHGVGYALRFNASNGSEGFFMHYPENDQKVQTPRSPFMDAYVTDRAPNTSQCTWCHRKDNATQRQHWARPIQITPETMYGAQETDECYNCHSKTRNQAKNFHVRDLFKGIRCDQCHFNFTKMNASYGRPDRWVNETMFNSSVHGRSGIFGVGNVLYCTNCHTITRHPPSEAGWRWCEDCHVVPPRYANESPNIDDPQRHNLTNRPQNVSINVSGVMKSLVNVTNYTATQEGGCKACHSQTLYDNARATFNASIDKNCRFCHTFPDKMPGSPY